MMKTYALILRKKKKVSEPKHIRANSEKRFVIRKLKRLWGQTEGERGAEKQKADLSLTLCLSIGCPPNTADN